MRSEKELISQILGLANTNDLIRAVLLTGSRADPKIVKDSFQDFDVTYVFSLWRKSKRNLKKTAWQ
jgi:aminoglycoside 6-adenylyltransferase